MKSAAKMLMIALLLLAWVLPAFAAPYSNNANMAVQWLSSHQNIDGSWGSGDTKYPCTAETVLALQAMNQRNSAYYWGISWLENNSAQNTDYMARRILALAPHGDNVTSEVTSLQTAQAITQPGNSGWGLTSSYQGSPLDSALALLAYSQQGVTTNVPAALAYLKSSQLTTINDMGWPVAQETTSDPATTALVVLALTANIASDSTLNTNIANGITALAAKVSGSSPAHIQALASLAYAKAGYPAQGTALLNSLTALQAADGSWGQDPYATAITVRAMAAAIGSDVSTLSAMVAITDPNLRAAINSALGRNNMDALNKGDLASLTSLNAQGRGITNLTGLEWAVNLTSIDLRGNSIGSLAPLSGLTQLTQVSIEPQLTVDPAIAVTTGSNMTFTGTISSGATVTITSTTTAHVVQTTYPTATTWRSDINGLVEGINTFTITANNTWGSSPSIQKSVSKDSTPPFLTVNTVSPIRSTTSTLTGTVEAGATVAVTTQGTASTGMIIYPTQTTWSCALSSLAAGTNSFTVTATDAIGNSSVVLASVTVVPPISAAISPTTVSSDYQGAVSLTISSLPAAGDEVLIEQFVDANRNGQIDAADYVVRSFKITDGAANSNPNIPKDTDGAANSAIITSLGYYQQNDLYHAPGDYLVRASKDAESSIVSFKVTQVSQTQTVAGTVTDGTNPVPGAVVQLTDKWQRHVSYVIADASGHFVLNIKQPGDYMLLPLAYGYVASPAPVSLAASQNIENQSLTLTAGTNHVTGNVKSASSGAGIAGVWVLMNGNNSSGVAITNVSGSFETWLPSGQFNFTVPVVTGGQGLFSNGYAGFDKHPVTVTVGGTTVIPDINMPAGDVLISGYVLDAFGNPVAGLPVEGKIRGTIDNREPVSFGVSDANGAYSLGLFSATNWDIFIDNSTSQTLGYLGTIRRDLSTAIGPLSGNNLTAQPITAWVEGIVRDSANQILPGVEVKLRNSDSSVVTNVSTTTDGKYRIGAYAGSWFIDALTENRGTHPVSEQAFALTDGQTATVDFVVDVTPPILVINPVATPTNSNVQTVTGTVESGATVSVTVNTSAVAGVVNYPTATTWSCTINVLAEGSNTITATAVDAAGNPATASTTILLDTTPPTVVINSPVNGGDYDPTPTLSYSVSDGTVIVKVDGTVVNKVSGNSLNTLANGSHTVRVEAIDAAGNTGFAEVSFAVTYQPLAISTNSLESGYGSVSYSQSLAATGGKTPYTWSLASGSLPAGLGLNSLTGVISGTPTIIGSSSFTIQVTDSTGANVSKSFTIAITTAPPPTITTNALPDAYMGKVYNQVLAATGGYPAYSWSITKLGGCAFLTMSTSGVISGTPPNSGICSFTATVTDSLGGIASKSFSLNKLAELKVSTTSLPNGKVGIAYINTLAATGGKTPYSWSIASGTLPAGLALNSSTGGINGTPTTSGNSTIVIRVTDSNGVTMTKGFTIIITSQ